MARGSKDYDKKVREVNKGQSSKKKVDKIHGMLEALIGDDIETADANFHDYLQAKMRDMIMGEEQVDEQDRAAQFSRSGTVMDDGVKGDIKFKNGGKKTIKKLPDTAKELNNDNVGKTEFKKGGKQPAKVLEKTPKPAKFDDGRRFDLGTTDK